MANCVICQKMKSEPGQLADDSSSHLEDLASHVQSSVQEDEEPVSHPFIRPYPHNRAAIDAQIAQVDEQDAQRSK